MNRIIKLKLRHWWNRSQLLHFISMALLGIALGVALCYVLAIMLAPVIQTLNSH